MTEKTVRVEIFSFSPVYPSVEGNLVVKNPNEKSSTDSNLQPTPIQTASSKQQAAISKIWLAYIKLVRCFFMGLTNPAISISMFHN